jgi:uncharacterized protein
MIVFNQDFTIFFCLLLAVVAFLYSSVGHGGASGYLALMAIFNFPVAIMKPSALLLNLFVSSISFLFYYRKKFFKFKLFWPFAITSVPAAYFGAKFPLDETIYKIILGIVLIFAAVRVLGFFSSKEKATKPIHIPLAMAIGLFIGLLSGMLGIGGGVILSPIVLLLGWATLKEAGALSSLFIFVNSFAGLSDYFSGIKSFPIESFQLVPIALIGGLLGGFYGSDFFSNKALKYVLATVIVIASVKLIV